LRLSAQRPAAAGTFFYRSIPDRKIRSRHIPGVDRRLDPQRRRRELVRHSHARVRAVVGSVSILLHRCHRGGGAGGFLTLHDHAAGPSGFLHFHHARLRLVRIHHADREYARLAAEGHIDQSVTLYHRGFARDFSRGRRPGIGLAPVVAAGADVVHIDVTQRREISNPMMPFGNDPFFHFFFNGPQVPRKFKQELKGLGTGMLIDDKGNILTNNHVVAGATEINVLLADGTTYPAKLVGTDPKTDLAVIRIETDEKLPAVTFGDSDRMEVGDWVVAIGHPRGLDETVTQGIISAKHRRGVLDPTSYQDYLQTDAAINPGNSGGPLLNLSGQVVGVNAAIASESGGFEGIGFAIPSNMAVHVARALIDHGKVIRGWLGVSIRDLTPGSSQIHETQGQKGSPDCRGGPEQPRPMPPD
jgi:S1-C subfamily serine protease